MKAAHSAQNGCSCISLKKRNWESVCTDLLDLRNMGWGVQCGCLQTGEAENLIAVQSMKLDVSNGPSLSLHAW